MRKSTNASARGWIQPVNTAHLAALFFALLAATLTGCAVEWQNPQAARQLAREEQPAGSVYLGWRVYQDRCASCHGADARGTGNAPNLLTRLQTLGPRDFVSLVLYRYDTTLQGPPASTRGTRDGQVDSVMTRQGQLLTMPAWQDEPRVNAHILDLYAYLSARSQGRLGTGKPSP
ncbi:cytochrome c [Hylemonella sp. W303a]|uniref:cytochrome c n=1 Tax=Hylemonella sp. W303a TaxID=3389873 RepID=UPI00396B0254